MSASWPSGGVLAEVQPLTSWEAILATLLRPQAGVKFNSILCRILLSDLKRISFPSHGLKAALSPTAIHGGREQQYWLGGQHFPQLLLGGGEGAAVTALSPTQ